MVQERVRVPAARGVPPQALRRKPSQSRVRVSQEALQEAFVRVLLDVGFEAMTVREITGVAGVGIGTFYEYLGSKQALAALTIHMRVKALGRGLHEAAAALRGQPVQQVLEALLDQQVNAIRADARAWAALFLLERQISSPEAYRKNYRRYVEAWESSLAVASDHPPGERLPALARMVHVLVYGWVSQALLTQGARVDWPLMRTELGLAVRGYLAATGPSSVA